MSQKTGGLLIGTLAESQKCTQKSSDFFFSYRIAEIFWVQFRATYLKSAKVPISNPLVFGLIYHVKYSQIFHNFIQAVKSKKRKTSTLVVASLVTWHIQRVHLTKNNVLDMQIGCTVYVQQYVSDVAHFVKSDSFITSSVTNRKWVASCIYLWKAVSSQLFYDQQQVSDTSCTFCERQSHCFFFLWPTGCEWHCKLCVSVVKGSLIISFPMIYRMWVIWYILWKAISSLLFIWSTGCEW